MRRDKLARRYAPQTAASRCADVWDLLNSPMMPGLTVYEAESTGVPTGLFDAQGNKLVAYETREPMGVVPGGRVKS